jgi:hypothetical protein
VPFSQSNLQDVVVLNQATLSVLGEQIWLGSDAGSKSIVFAQDPAGASAIYLAASNATGAETIVIPDANGTIGLITAISAGTTLASNGQLVFSNSNGVTFGINGSTITASVAGASAGIAAISAGTTQATSGTVVFSNSNGVTFGVSGNTVTASVSPSGGGVGIAAGSQTATSGTVAFSNSNGISFGMSGSTQVTASVAHRAYALFLAGV